MRVRGEGEEGREKNGERKGRMLKREEGEREGGEGVEGGRRRRRKKKGGGEGESKGKQGNNMIHRQLQ